MKTIFKIFMVSFLGLIVIGLGSCKKDKDGPDSCLLSTIKVTEVADGETYTENIQLLYDNDDKLQQFTGDDFTAKFFYNSQGKLERIEMYDEGVMESLMEIGWSGNTATISYFWIEDGTLTSSNFKEVYSFNEKNEVTKIESFAKWGGETWIMYSYDNFSWLNGNVTKIEEYYLDWGAKSSVAGLRSHKGLFLRTPVKPDFALEEIFEKSEALDFVKEYTTTFTYDDKFNPFSPHEAFRLLTGWASFMSKNNVLTETELEHYDNTEEVSSYTYEYNTRNFPLKMNMTSGNYTTQWEMTYICD
jgi:hypothetical protein